MIGMQTLFASNAIQNPEQKAGRAPFNDAFRPKNAGIVTCSTGLASSCLLLFWETSIFSFYSSIESKWDWETFFSLSSEFKWRDVSDCRFANYFSLCDISQVLFRHFHWGREGHIMWLMSGLATPGATHHWADETPGTRRTPPGQGGPAWSLYGHYMVSVTIL